MIAPIVGRPIQRRSNLCCLLVSLLLLSVVAGGSSMAAQVSGLYEAEVPVEGQDTAQRNKAIVEAFRRVLVKVTGNRGIARHPQLAGDIPKAPRYVQQYRYRLVPAEAPIEPAGILPGLEVEAAPLPPPPTGPVRMLRVHFDENAVNRLLHQRGLPVWGGIRPTALVWLSAEQDGRRSLLSPEADGEALSGMLAAAEERSVPVLFPLMDLEDQSSLQASDVWGGFADNIRLASERYGPDAIMTARLVRFGPDLWRADWTLYLGQDEFIWDSEGDSLAMAVEAGVQSGMDVLASRFAPLAGDSSIGRMRLHVTGVKNIRGYARIKRYLTELGAVEKAELVSVEPDAVDYALRIRGGRQALEQDVALSGVLLPVPQGETDAGTAPKLSPPAGLSDAGEPVLHYRLRP